MSKFSSRRIEAEIHISADSWCALSETIDAIGQEIHAAQAADENLYWTSATETVSADVSIKTERREKEYESYKR